VYYTQLLRVACGLKWLAIIEFTIVALVVLIAAANGAFSHPNHPDPNTDIPLPALFAIAAFFASGLAARFARTLSEENETHLPVAWTKPVSRAKFALTTIGVDALGILAAFVLTLTVCILFIATFGGAQFIVASSDTPMQLLRFLALPFAYYGVLTALTASFGKTGRGLIGWGVVFSLVIAMFGGFDLPKPYNTIVNVINVFNPLSYATYHHTRGNDTVNILSGPNGTVFAALTLGADVAALGLLCVAGLGAGIYQWRRVEA
jgi:hypothetical protein